jgi:hypothetical protein
VNRISASCFGEVEIEGLAGQFVSLGFQRHDFLADFVALAGEHCTVDQDAGAFHLPDHLAGPAFRSRYRCGSGRFPR